MADKTINEIVAEIKAKEAAEKAAQDEKLQKAVAPLNAWKAEQEKKKELELERERAERKEKQEKGKLQVENGIRDDFFAANPHADEKDFQEMLPKLREALMLKNAEQREQEFEAAKRKQIAGW